MSTFFESKSQLYNFTYQKLLKPIFFLFDAELIHNLLIKFGSILGSNIFLKKILQAFFSFYHPSIVKEIDGISFPGPVGLSAGFDYNGDLTQILPFLGFGWHTIGTVTWLPYPGNPKPRLSRYPNSQALLVNKGLKTIGAPALIKKLENKPLFTIPTGISIASTNKYFNSTKEQLMDILMSFVAFEKAKLNHQYYEMNISCPNTYGGEPFITPHRLDILLSCLDRLNLTRPLYIKMPIDQNEQTSLNLLMVASKHNVQGVILGNLTKDKHNHLVNKADQQDWQNKKGNLSGKPTWERSNNFIKLAHQHFPNRFTIIGTGGIFSGQDAQTKMDLGADLVQLITGMIFQGPQLIGQINHYLSSKQLKTN